MQSQNPELVALHYEGQINCPTIALMPGTSDAPIEIEPGPVQQGDLLTFDEDGDLRLMVGTNPS